MLCIAKVPLLASLVCVFKQFQYENCSLAKNMKKGFRIDVACFVLEIQKDLHRAYSNLKRIK